MPVFHINTYAGGGWDVYFFLDPVGFPPKKNTSWLCEWLVHKIDHRSDHGMLNILLPLKKTENPKNRTYLWMRIFGVWRYHQVHTQNCKGCRTSSIPVFFSLTKSLGPNKIRYRIIFQNRHILATKNACFGEIRYFFSLVSLQHSCRVSPLLYVVWY